MKQPQLFETAEPKPEKPEPKLKQNVDSENKSVDVVQMKNILEPIDLTVSNRSNLSEICLIKIQAHIDCLAQKTLTKENEFRDERDYEHEVEQIVYYDIRKKYGIENVIQEAVLQSVEDMREKQASD